MLFELGLAGWVGWIRQKGGEGHLRSPWVKALYPLIHLAFLDQIHTSKTLFQLCQSLTQTFHDSPMIKWRVQPPFWGRRTSTISTAHVLRLITHNFLTVMGRIFMPSFLCRIPHYDIFACQNYSSFKTQLRANCSMKLSSTSKTEMNFPLLSFCISSCQRISLWHLWAVQSCVYKCAAFLLVGGWGPHLTVPVALDVFNNYLLIIRVAQGRTVWGMWQKASEGMGSSVTETWPVLSTSVGRDEDQRDILKFIKKYNFSRMNFRWLSSKHSFWCIIFRYIVLLLLLSTLPPTKSLRPSPAKFSLLSCDQTTQWQLLVAVPRPQFTVLPSTM